MTIKNTILPMIFALMMIKSFAQESWKLAKNKDGIKVYVGEIPNSDYYAFKAIMFVSSTQENVLKVLSDVEKYSEWFAYTASAQLIKQADNKQLIFMETDYPWPYANECMNYWITYNKLPDNRLKINLEGTNKNIHCRYSLKKANGYILLDPASKNTKITYYFHSEPSQSIPPWLINPMIHDMPFQTFAALKEKLAFLNP